MSERQSQEGLMTGADQKHTVIQFELTPTTIDRTQVDTEGISEKSPIFAQSHDILSVQTEAPSIMKSEDELSPVESTDTHEKEEIETIMKTSKMTPMQKNAYIFFEYPRTFLSRAFFRISITFIFISALMLSLETLPVFLNSESESALTKMLFPLDAVIVIWWTLELTGRFYASPNKLTFFTQIFNLIDVFSILPFFLLLSNDPAAIAVGRSLRVLRLPKVFKLARYSMGIQLALRALRRSMDAIWLLFIFLLLAILSSSTVMYWAERGTFDGADKTWIRGDGTRSPFQSIPEGFYWSMTTLTTVGYGDIVPVTLTGKILTALTMLASILTIALPTSIIGSNFMAEWQINQRAQLQKKMKKNREKKQKSQTYVEKKSDQIKTLSEQNSLLLQSIGEVQEKLNDVNPPQYYQSYKELKSKYEKTLRDHEVEMDILKRKKDKWKKIAKDTTKVSKSKDFNVSKSDVDSGDDVETTKQSTIHHISSVLHDKLKKTTTGVVHSRDETTKSVSNLTKKMKAKLKPKQHQHDETTTDVVAYVPGAVMKRSNSWHSPSAVASFKSTRAPDEDVEI